MRIPRLVVAIASLVLGLSSAIDGAHAQSLFQQFFGLGGPPPHTLRAPEPANAPRQVSRSQGEAPRRGSEGGDGGGTKYRTMCVRLCDGYYFPINYSVGRKQLAQDERQCRASCGSEGQLFYTPTQGGEPADMINLEGQAYKALPTAFRYRKSLVSGCRCKPMPWSEAELARHESYAVAEAAVRAKEEALRAKHDEKSQAVAAAAEAGASVPGGVDGAGEGKAGLGSDEAKPVRVAEPLEVPAEEPVASRPVRVWAPGRGEGTRTKKGQERGRERPVVAVINGEVEKPRRHVVKASAGGVSLGGGLFAGGPGKFVYPGDAPMRRVR